MAVEDLKKNAMVAHLIDVLDHKEDIGHYGRLVFTRVAQHFLSEYEVVAELAKDKEFSEEQARSLYLQVQSKTITHPSARRSCSTSRSRNFRSSPTRTTRIRAMCTGT